MPQQKYIVALGESEVAQLKKIVSSGTHKARTITRARALLMANDSDKTGKPDPQIAEALDVSIFIPRSVRFHYVQGGLERALYEAPRPGKPKVFTPEDEAQVVALACTDAPPGYSRWTLILLAKELSVKLGKPIGRNTIDIILLKNQCKPWLKKNVVYSKD